MRAPLYAAMTDGTYWGWYLVGALGIWLLLILTAAALAHAAGKPRPRMPVDPGGER